MKSFINKANLPDKKVRTVIAGNLPEYTKELFNKDGIEVLEIISESVLSTPVSFHADLQCIHLKNERILLNKNQTDLKIELENLGFNVDLFEIKKGEHPFDCCVNAAFIGNKVICKFDILEEKLKKYIVDNKLNVINVNQGYSKCSVCIVDDNSIITEDESVKNTCEKHGFDVLFIRKGFVRLDGYDYGFIGGASFKTDKDTLAFIGKVENHPDYERIRDFTSKKGIRIRSYSDFELTDVGSIIPIIQ